LLLCGTSINTTTIDTTTIGPEETTQLVQVPSPSGTVVTTDSMSSVHDLWSYVDEKYLKFFFGGRKKNQKKELLFLLLLLLLRI
jgi:hypothetical protein